MAGEVVRKKKIEGERRREVGESEEERMEEGEGEGKGGICYSLAVARFTTSATAKPRHIPFSSLSLPHFSLPPTSYLPHFASSSLLLPPLLSFFYLP